MHDGMNLFRSLRFHFFISDKNKRFYFDLPNISMILLQLTRECLIRTKSEEKSEGEIEHENEVKKRQHTKKLSDLVYRLPR